MAARDNDCIYCRLPFALKPRGRRSSWEHIVNDAKIVNSGNIALCCIQCNSSKGARELKEWLASKYCKTRGITVETVAPVVRAALGLLDEVAE